MSSLDGVPLKMPLGVLQEIKEEMKPVIAPEITLPDYLTILQETEYEFSLENWVLAGLQGGYPCQDPGPCCPSGMLASCPPYWLMLSSPQQSRSARRLRSASTETNPRRRSHSLNLADLRAAVHFTVSDSEDEGEDSAEKVKTSTPEKASLEKDPTSALCQRGPRKAQKAFTPNLLNPPACLSSLPHQRRKNLRQCSLSALETSCEENQKATSPTGSNQSHNPKPLSLCSCLSAAPSVASQPLGSHTAALDSSVELLSALSPEERELLAAVTNRGYPLRSAIIALQKTGQQTPEQILSYLVACDHLCELGYDQAQVEEALEMFQNCETKAQEFLHLLRQFNEMGFQQNTIKEVLLVHENHRERALEELMMHVT
ncbi:ubiquitin-associated protein 1-like [Polymixia lowei]